MAVHAIELYVLGIQCFQVYIVETRTYAMAFQFSDWPTFLSHGRNLAWPENENVSMTVHK